METRLQAYVIKSEGHNKISERKKEWAKRFTDAEFGDSTSCWIWLIESKMRKRWVP